MATRRMRAFKRWMRCQGVKYSDALVLNDLEEEGLTVTALCDLREGDMVGAIPKRCCLTVKTSGARQLLGDFGLEGYLGLSFALMYEKSLGPRSPWFGYLQLLPDFECLPLLWSFDEIDSLLVGTELHKTVKEDKTLVYEDWKECIVPFLDSTAVELDPSFFGIEQYFAAKSLVASRSFEIDGYHGFGMVPFADLFNHKTDAEDVHFTSASSVSDFGDDTRDLNDEIVDGGFSQSSELTFGSVESCFGGGASCSTAILDGPDILQLIMVKDVKAGAEVFNTYGCMGNAALLYRYGFTEPDNPYNIVNIDLEMVLQWSLSLFSSRHSRSRLSFWRKLNCSGSLSQDSEYFEISPDGEPQIELLTLLNLILLTEDVYNELLLRISTTERIEKSASFALLSSWEALVLGKASEESKSSILTKSVRSSLLSLADIRESLYGSNSLEEEVEALNKCCPSRDRKLYHSLMLRISERRILQKLRTYASAGDQFEPAKAFLRRELKGS